MSEAAGRWARRGAKILGVAGVILAVLAVRVVTASQGELERADRLREQGDLDAAIVHYRRAARWYAPASPYPPEALTALSEIAAEAEREGDRRLALTAWRAVRAAIMSTRSFYVPYEGRLEEANRHIAELMASLDPPPIDAGKSRAELRDEHLALLRSVERPDPAWTLVLLFGFALWVGAAFGFATRAVDEEDRVVRSAALRWGLAVAVGFALFVLGLALA